MVVGLVTAAAASVGTSYIADLEAIYGVPPTRLTKYLMAVSAIVHLCWLLAFIWGV